VLLSAVHLHQIKKRRAESNLGAFRVLVAALSPIAPQDSDGWFRRRPKFEIVVPDRFEEDFARSKEQLLWFRH
jgi:hypothetical protein